MLLVSRPALLDLLLERAKRLISGAANGADQRRAILDEGLKILAQEPVL